MSTKPRSTPPVDRAGKLLAAALVLEAIALTVLVMSGGTAAWAAVRRRGGQAWRVVAALAAGTVGVVAGAGLGAGHLAKSVVSATTWLGLVVLAAGVLLLGYGVVLAVRALHRWWRLLALPAGFVLFSSYCCPWQWPCTRRTCRPPPWVPTIRPGTDCPIRTSC
jgi:hypothetical protein